MNIYVFYNVKNQQAHVNQKICPTGYLTRRTGTQKRKKLVLTKKYNNQSTITFLYCEFRSESADNCCGRGDLDAVCRQQGGGRERTGNQ
jgi:hypothetical protein